jgi:hypothetical protein
MISRLAAIAGSAFLLFCVGCGSSEDSDAKPVESAEPELRSVSPGDFAMVERPGAHALDPFGCRHYMKLRLTAGSGALSPALDSDNPQDMDPDGACGGEELPRNATSTYPLRFVERTACGASVYTGTITWTTSGAVTRTMKLTDYRGSTCPPAEVPSRIVAAITSTYQGQSNPIATYYSVDPRP